MQITEGQYQPFLVQTLVGEAQVLWGKTLGMGLGKAFPSPSSGIKPGGRMLIQGVMQALTRGECALEVQGPTHVHT